MKLLAKTAEERYQTAAGVAADLWRCLREWETHRHIDLFPLGAHDVSDRLLIPENPLALFLDDLQWLDAATLELLEHLITKAEVRHLLLVGTYRDNEVSPSHPLMRALDAIHNAGASSQRIVLAPLVVDDVGRLVADSLHCERDSARPLAQLVRARGN
jgi:hypothetical protein